MVFKQHNVLLLTSTQPNQITTVKVPPKTLAL